MTKTASEEETVNQNSLPLFERLGEASGVVTTSEYISDGAGEQFTMFYSSRWVVYADSALGGEDFRSREGWSLAALNPAGRPLLIVPGCRVAGFAAADRPPDKIRQVKILG